MDHDPHIGLWRRAQAGDERAFADLRRALRPVVWSEIRKRTWHAGASDMEDIESLVWVAVWRGLPGFQGRALLVTWVTGIAKNTCFGWLRKANLERGGQECVLHEVEQETHASPDQAVVRSLHLRQEIKKLPINEQKVILLRYVAQLTDVEISQRMRAPLGTVKSWLRAGVRRLGDSYKGSVDEEREFG